MKKEFSTHWKSSKQPRKQRKYRAKAPLHIKRKLLNVGLSKELRKKEQKRTIVIRKGDKVKITKGKYKGKTAKVEEVKINLGKIYLEGMQVKKQEGSKVNIPFRPANLQIIELNTDDKRRMKTKLKNSKTEQVKEEKK
ncbi:50S ribosomal protein L24 [Candidatus Pacearchaeota archaeon ex4484_71]|nr:MAG: 50S ribosomal protein L24 [Candidatus Pacearchaeota archaeon ex4484_71]